MAVALAVGLGLHVLDGELGRRIVRTGLADDHGGGRVEGHHLFHVVELDRLQLFLALGAPVELAIDALLHEGNRGVLQLLGSDHGIHGAVLQCHIGFLLGAGGNPLGGVVDTDHAHQAHGTAEARHDAQFHFRQADLGGGGHDAVFAGQAHFKTAAQREAVDGDDLGHFEVFESGEHLVGADAPFGDLGFATAEQRTEFGDVGADDEHALAGRDDDTLHVLARLDCFRGRAELGERGTVELVHGFVGEIEFELSDAALEERNADG
ncbi:MAG: hypothetical protein K0Q68_3298 [Moraxellaceae bacterium]|nr:hypothetical protein [Moraxellaceae bacterium]